MTPTHPESELVALLELSEMVSQAVATELYGDPPPVGNNSLTRGMQIHAIRKAVVSALSTRAATVPQGVLDRDAELREALAEVIRATRAYLPPDGVSPQDCISRVLAATDNARINAVMGEIK